MYRSYRLYILIFGVVVYVMSGKIQQTYAACDVCKNRTMPIYSTIFPFVQDILLLIPNSIPKPIFHTNFKEVELQKAYLDFNTSKQCLRERYETTLEQDSKIGIDDTVTKFVDPIADLVGSINISNTTKDIAIMKKPQIVSDEYNQIKKLHDLINDKFMVLASECTHTRIIPNEIQNQIIDVFNKNKKLFTTVQGANLIIETESDQLSYQDILLFLKDVVGQSQIYLAKDQIFDGDFYKKSEIKEQNKKAQYSNINVKLNPDFITSIDQLYACTRDVSLDIEKVCRKQEAQFWQIIKTIVGKSSIESFTSYGNDVSEDRDAMGGQLGDDTDALKGAYKASIKRMTNAINMLRQSNFGFKSTPARDSLLESYYNRDINDIRNYTIKSQATQGVSSIKKRIDIMLGESQTSAPQVSLASKQNTNTIVAFFKKAFYGVDPNPTNVSQFIDPTSTTIAKSKYNILTQSFNSVLQDFDTESSNALHYDPSNQIQVLPRISKKIYQSMISLGSRDEADTLINGLNIICKQACGPEGSCG